MDTNADNTQPDIILTGAGMMSATPGTLLKALDPTCSIEIFARLMRCLQKVQMPATMPANRQCMLPMVRWLYC